MTPAKSSHVSHGLSKVLQTVCFTPLREKLCINIVKCSSFSMYFYAVKPKCQLDLQVCKMSGCDSVVWIISFGL